MIAATRALWEPRYGRRLTDEEARQILDHVLGYCRTLLAWDTDHVAGALADEAA